MEQKRIVIDQGFRCSLLIPSFEPIHVVPWANGNTAKENEGRGNESGSRRKGWEGGREREGKGESVIKCETNEWIVFREGRK